MTQTRAARALILMSLLSLVAVSAGAAAVPVEAPLLPNGARSSENFWGCIQDPLGCLFDPGGKKKPAPSPIPWRAKPGLKGILFPDVNMFTRVQDWNKLSNASHGIVGIKVWETRYGVDPTFEGNLKQASRRKMIVIGYVFGVGGARGAAQASFVLKHFLLDKRGHAIPGRILALDLEQNPFGPTMTLAEATAFVRYVRARSGRYPILYGSGPRPGVLARCLRWIPSYGPKPGGPAIWQFTDGKIGPGPHRFPGVGKCDINRIFITYKDLRRWAGV